PDGPIVTSWQYSPSCSRDGPIEAMQGIVESTIRRLSPSCSRDGPIEAFGPRKEEKMSNNSLRRVHATAPLKLVAALASNFLASQALRRVHATAPLKRTVREPGVSA